MSVFADLVSQFAQALAPLFHSFAMAAAIVAVTMAVRLALHPLTRAAARGEKARTRLAPRVAELRRRHGDDPERLRKAMAELYAKENTSPLAGCLPMLVQLPVFFLMYHLFSSTSVGGEPNELLGHTLFAAPLGDRWTDALAHGGVFGARGVVYLGLFAVIAAVATWTYVRSRRTIAAAAAAATSPQEAVPGMAGLMKVMPLLSFGTLITAAVVPLAAALYLVTSTTWTAVERAWLHRERPEEKSAAAVPA
ncbi:YidC/Oxa1 family membrane protein insertase [Streptomyces sp. URMC 123]|uniref:YidC/Oxa1 family membrane protein insertase n=1 Tax=Streptomyces sp. URMC 123 TaxID=3423403 RepID=UPI003F1E3986